jgi:hypothetical protein
MTTKELLLAAGTGKRDKVKRIIAKGVVAVDARDEVVHPLAVIF